MTAVTLQYDWQSWRSMDEVIPQCESGRTSTRMSSYCDTPSASQKTDGCHTTDSTNHICVRSLNTIFLLGKVKKFFLLLSLNQIFSTFAKNMGMKKTFCWLLGLMLMSFCTNVMGQNKVHWKTSTEEVTFNKAKKPFKRKDYKFTYSFAKNEEGQYAYIDVEGWINKKTIAFTCRCNLVEEQEKMPDGEGWISETDINFDGVPDLMIYMGLQAWGQVASFYDAYVWNVEKAQFDHVDIFDSIGEPLIDEENHCITSTGRNGPYHITTQTYEWRNGELVLTKEETEKIEEWEEEEEE